MAFQRPTLSELIDRVQADFVSRLDLAGALLRRSMTYVTARVVAGAAHMLHGHIEFLGRQLFPDTSEVEYLDRQGAVFGVTRNAPTYATGNVTITGTDTTVIVAGTILIREDDAEYTTDADATISSGTATVAVTASTADEASNSDVGTALSFQSPVDGADASVLVASGGLSGGADRESDDEYRTRVLERLRSPPHGGSEADYIAWAKEVSGVTRAWVYPAELGAGTVTVRFVRDDDTSIIPDSGEVTAVQDYIDALRPVTADLTVVAPVASTLDFTVSITPDNSDTRAAVQAELEDLLQREAEPGGTLLLSAVRTAVGTADGVTDYVLTSPAADVTHSTGELATMGTITWV